MTDRKGMAHIDNVERIPVFMGSSTIAYQLPEGNDPEAIRARISILKTVTERCYMRLAKDLWDCFQRKLYIEYGYDTFDDYVAAEVGISKDRAHRLKRIFSVLVLKCDLSPSEIEEAERSRVELILGVVNRENARQWLNDAKLLRYKDLKTKLRHERDRRRPPTPAATKEERPVDITPVRLACESKQVKQIKEEFVQRTFRLPTDGDTLLTEALGVAQRVTGSHSDNFNLICIAQQFLAHNITVEGKDDGRCSYFQRWMEEIYGGRFIHIKTDKAWDVLREAIEGHPDLFGTSGGIK